MSNKLEKAVRDPSLSYARSMGIVEADKFVPGNRGLHKRMHFGHGAAAGWPDDLIVFGDGHHWWPEFKKNGGEASPLQQHIHKNIRALRGDVSVIDTFEQFKEELNARLMAHAA